MTVERDDGLKTIIGGRANFDQNVFLRLPIYLKNSEIINERMATNNGTIEAIRTVKKGAKGSITRIIQGMLYCLNYNPKGFDGIFGDGTESAVEIFQGDNSLSIDGIVGKNTLSEMF